MGMHVLLVGNPVDGLTVYGPFKTGEDANDWGDDYLAGEEWWAVALVSPETAPYWDWVLTHSEDTE